MKLPSSHPILPSAWSRDHWRTFLHIGDVCDACSGFQVGADTWMRANEENAAYLAHKCPRPRRHRASTFIPGVMRPGTDTEIKPGHRIDGHDDWACAQDMAAAGLLAAKPGDIEPGAVVMLSELGWEVRRALLNHKAEGGTFDGFPLPAALRNQELLMRATPEDTAQGSVVQTPDPADHSVQLDLV